MKKALLLTVSIFLYLNSNAQTLQSVTDNGSSTTNHINLTADNQELRFYRSGTAYGFLWSSINGLHFGKGSAANSITVSNTGNVGIGTLSPTNKLQVEGNIGWSGYNTGKAQPFGLLCL